jgi:hypothetical protein
MRTKMFLTHPGNKRAMKSPCRGCRYEFEQKGHVRGRPGHPVCSSCIDDPAGGPAKYADGIHENHLFQVTEWHRRKERARSFEEGDDGYVDIIMEDGYQCQT